MDSLVEKMHNNESLSAQVKKIDDRLSTQVFWFSIVALLISIFTVFQALWSVILTIAFGVSAIILAVFILLNYRKKRHLHQSLIVSDRELKAEKKKNQILNSVFQSLQEANTGKIFGTLRYTYGKVSDWNPINYEKNWLVYDVHDQLRTILKSLQRVVINIAPDRFNDKNVSVDLICTYPEDNNNDCDIPITKAADSKDSSKKMWKFVSRIPITAIKKSSKSDRTEKRTDKPWKLISSGDLSGNHKRILDYLANPLSFFSLVSYFGSWYANNKYDQQKIICIAEDDTEEEIRRKKKRKQKERKETEEEKQKKAEEKKQKEAEEKELLEKYCDHLKDRIGASDVKEKELLENYYEHIKGRIASTDVKGEKESDDNKVKELLEEYRKYLKRSIGNSATKEENEGKNTEEQKIEEFKQKIKEIEDIEKLKQEKTFFVHNVKDYENAKWNSTTKVWDGSAIGATICVRNDNPEHILVKAILTINTYGEPIHLPVGNSKYDQDGLTEKDYEKLFLKQILGAYSTLIASELSQMYIRHQLMDGRMAPTTGTPIPKTTT